MSRLKKNEQGFTLVEVLAALLVFSLSIIGLTHAGTQSARAVSIISEKSLAGIVADNALIKARIQPLNLGSAKGEETQMGQIFTYRVTTAQTPVENFYSLNVSVQREGFEQVIITRQAYRGGS